MRGTKLDFGQLRNMLNRSTGDTMIWAPRQSGKTHALVRLFVESRNSAFFCVNAHARRSIDDHLGVLGRPDKFMDVYTATATRTIRGRRFDQIFIDEIDAYSGNWQELWSAIGPVNGRIIAMSTPHGVRRRSDYENVFHSEYTLTQEDFTEWRQSDNLIIMDHFDSNEQELFRI